MVSKQPVKYRTKSKKQGFQFSWWMAVGLVVIVAVVGVLVVRFSRASGQTFDITVNSAVRDGKYNIVQYYQGSGYNGTLTIPTYFPSQPDAYYDWTIDTNSYLLTGCGKVYNTAFKQVKGNKLTPGTNYKYEYTSDSSCPKG